MILHNIVLINMQKIIFEKNINIMPSKKKQKQIHY